MHKYSIDLGESGRNDFWHEDKLTEDELFDLVSEACVKCSQKVLENGPLSRGFDGIHPFQLSMFDMLYSPYNEFGKEMEKLGFKFKEYQSPQAMIKLETFGVVMEVTPEDCPFDPSTYKGVKDGMYTDGSKHQKRQFKLHQLIRDELGEIEYPYDKVPEKKDGK